MENVEIETELLAGEMRMEPALAGSMGAVASYYLYLSADGTGLGHAVETTDGGKYHRRVAERMVAAWNACQGVATTDLVPGCVRGKEPGFVSWGRSCGRRIIHE